MEDCTFFSLSIAYFIDLEKLCKDVQEIARKCGKNIIDNYGRIIHCIE